METVSSTSGVRSMWFDYLDNVVRGLLLAYVLVLPFKALLILERNGFLLLLGLLTVWCVLNRRFFYMRTPYDAMLLAFVVWVGCTLPFAVDPLYSLKEYGKLLQHVLVFYAVGYFLREPHYRQALCSLIAVMTILVAGYGLTQFNLVDGQAVNSVFPAEVWFTTFLVMVFPFALATACYGGIQEIRWLAVATSIVVVCCLLITQSRAGFLALVVELGVMAWLIRARSVKIIAGLGVVCSIAVVCIVLFRPAIPMGGHGSDLADAIPMKKGFASVVHRLDIWAFTASKILDHWLVGIGYGNYSYVLLYGQEQEVVLSGHSAITHSGAHNIVLFLALHVGLPGLFIFSWLYYSLIMGTLREYRVASQWRQKSILAGSVGSLVGLLCRLQFDQMLVGSLAILFWVLMGMTILHYKDANQLEQECVRAG